MTVRGNAVGVTARDLHLDVEGDFDLGTDQAV
jgi:hypothetical protein